MPIFVRSFSDKDWLLSDKIELEMRLERKEFVVTSDASKVKEQDLISTIKEEGVSAKVIKSDHPKPVQKMNCKGRFHADT